MLFALILVSVGFAVTLGLLLFRDKGGASVGHASVSSPSSRGELESETKARAKAESEVQRKQKELDEQRAQLQEVKEQLKQTKRKLFEQKEGEKGSNDLVKARAEVERNASMQLEQTRAELAQALTENSRLRAETESRNGPRRREAPAAAPAQTTAPAAVPASVEAPAPADQIAAPASEPVVIAAVSVTPAPVAPAEPVRRYRELNDADREKMNRLEQAANKDRSRAAELEKEVRRLKGRADTHARILSVTKSEADLGKDKYKALEKRLNRTLLERDLLRRAIKDLEKKTGMLADRTELTPDEVAASDQRSDDAARARAEAEARAAAPATPTEAAPTETPAAPSSPEGEAKPSEAPPTNV